MKTKESLGIIWSFQTEAGIRQDEVDGLIFYGFWNEDDIDKSNLSLDEFKRNWPMLSISTKHRLSNVENTAQLSIEIKIDQWPNEDQWLGCIETSLKWIVEQGAAIAWCGTEYSSSHVSKLLSDSSSGNIYAAFSNRRGFVCDAGLEDEFKELSLETLDSFGEIAES